MSLLNLSNLLLFLQAACCLHFLVSLQRSTHDVSHGSALVVAQLLSLGEVAVFEGLLDVGHELGELSLTESGAQGEPALNAECNHGEEQRDNHRHHDTTFIDETEQVAVFHVVFTVAIDEVVGITQHEVVECYCCEETDYDDPDCVLNTLEALRLFLRGYCLSLCSCHNLIFCFWLLIKNLK